MNSQSTAALTPVLDTTKSATNRGKELDEPLYRANSHYIQTCDAFPPVRLPFAVSHISSGAFKLALVPVFVVVTYFFNGESLLGILLVRDE
jgi:hypothetical protein